MSEEKETYGVKDYEGFQNWTQEKWRVRYVVEVCVEDDTSEGIVERRHGELEQNKGPEVRVGLVGD